MPTLRLPRQARPAAALLALALSASGCFSGASHPITPRSPIIQGLLASPTAVASGGTATLSWSVSGADTLSIAPGVGTVTGTSVQVAPTATTTYTLTATNAGGSSTASVTVTVVQPPSGLAYAVNPAVYAVGTAITPNTPSYAGGVVSSWSVSPALPAGLSLDASTGILSGTPTAVTALAVYTIAGTNAAGSTAVDVTLTVTAPPPPAGLAYSANPATYVVGVAIAANTPSSTGGAIASYAVSPALPAGLSLGGDDRNHHRHPDRRRRAGRLHHHRHQCRREHHGLPDADGDRFARASGRPHLLGEPGYLRGGSRHRGERAFEHRGGHRLLRGVARASRRGSQSRRRRESSAERPPPLRPRPPTRSPAPTPPGAPRPP